MEDDSKISKVEYLGNRLLDHTQISNLSLDDKAIFYKSLKWRWPPMKDDLQWKMSSGAKITSKHATYEFLDGY